MRYLSQEDFEQARQLRAAGWTFKAIAARFGVSDATISNHLNGKSAPRKEKKQPFTGAAADNSIPFEEEDFSTKADDVLFKHVRVWDFIG